MSVGYGEHMDTPTTPQMLALLNSLNSMTLNSEILNCASHMLHTINMSPSAPPSHHHFCESQPKSTSMKSQWDMGNIWTPPRPTICHPPHPHHHKHTAMLHTISIVYLNHPNHCGRLEHNKHCCTHTMVGCLVYRAWTPPRLTICHPSHPHHH